MPFKNFPPKLDPNALRVEGKLMISVKVGNWCLESEAFLLKKMYDTWRSQYKQ